MSNILSLKSVSKSFPQPQGSLRVLENIDFAIAQGEVVALLGASGSGKTTLLQIAGLLSNPTSGEVLLKGEDVSQLSDAKRTKLRGESLGFVYQFHHLLPEFNALENVILPQLVGGISKKAATENATQLLTEFGLHGRLTHRPAQLSGGEMQRVAIARGLANNPSLLLADEPTGNLDDASSKIVFDQLMKAVTNRNMAALIVTHDEQLAKQCHRILRLQSGKLIAS